VLAVRLLVVRDADHEHLGAHPEVVRREARAEPHWPRRSPSHRPRSLPSRQVGLRDRRVRLVGPDGREVLPLVVDAAGVFRNASRRFARYRGSAARTGSTPPGLLRDRLGPVRTHLLADEFFGNSGSNASGGTAPSSRVEIGRERRREVGDIVPAFGRSSRSRRIFTSLAFVGPAELPA